jgi:hypothetical protein
MPSPCVSRVPWGRAQIAVGQRFALIPSSVVRVARLSGIRTGSARWLPGVPWTGFDGVLGFRTVNGAEAGLSNRRRPEDRKDCNHWLQSSANGGAEFPAPPGLCLLAQ